MSNKFSLSWLDPQNLKKLAEASGLSVSRVAAHTSRKAGAGWAQTGRPSLSWASGVNGPAASQVVAPLKSMPEGVTDAREGEETGSRPELPPFHPPNAAMGARLSAYIDWLIQNLACVRVFIADSDGLPLAQRNSNIDLIGLATVLMEATRQLRGHIELPPDASIAMELSENEIFQFVQVQTDWQKVSLGLIMPSVLDRKTLDHVKRALHNVFSEAGRESAIAKENSQGDPSQRINSSMVREISAAEEETEPSAHRTPELT